MCENEPMRSVYIAGIEKYVAKNTHIKWMHLKAWGFFSPLSSIYFQNDNIQLTCAGIFTDSKMWFKSFVIDLFNRKSFDVWLNFWVNKLKMGLGLNGIDCDSLLLG
jgi:hypothetical protein